MKAILLAHYAALLYIRQTGGKFFSADCEQMYFEVKEALQLVKDTELKRNKVRAQHYNNRILFFDLNHCNASNQPCNSLLEEKLSVLPASIIILDHSSSTTSEIQDSIKKCFAKKTTEFVIMADTGLKNNQFGGDFNPYGEVRVLARDKSLRDWLINMMKEKGLSPKDRLSLHAHELVRACKRKLGALSLFRVFEDSKEEKCQPSVIAKPRFQTVNRR